jgi:hypothetical protein
MKTILTILIFGSFNFTLASSLQDSTRNQNREKEQVQQQDQQRNQGEDDQIKNQNRVRNGNEIPDNGGKKRGKDVFIDKDGDGIADTRAGGMSLEKIRKRTRAGQQGSGGQGGNGTGGNGGGK